MAASPPTHLLRAPSVSRFVQARPRLALNETRAATTEVWAAAGSGKTTLLALWAQQLQAKHEKTAWVGLPASGTLRLSLPHLIQASFALNSAGGASAARASSTKGGASGPAGLKDIHGNVNLIIDDIHLLSGQADAAWLRDLIQSRPPEVRIVLAGRFPPPLLTDHRSPAGTAEYSTSDLAFTRDEVAGFFSARGLDLPPAEIDAFHERTGGWAAALTLLSGLLSGAGYGDSRGRDFDPAQQAIADYLVTEVLDSLPAAYRQFLLDASVADTLTVPLAAQLTQRPDAGEILAHLELHTGLLNRIGEPGAEMTYVFHPVLLRYLRAEFRRHDLAAYARALGSVAGRSYTAGDDAQATRTRHAASPSRALARDELALALAVFQRAEEAGNEARLDELVQSARQAPAPEVLFPALVLQLMYRIDAAKDLHHDYDVLERLLQGQAAAHPLTLAVCAVTYVATGLDLHERRRAAQAVELVQANLGVNSLESVVAGALYSDSTGRRSVAEAALETALRSTGRAWHPSTPVFGWIRLAAWAEQSGRTGSADAGIHRAVEAAELLEIRRPFLAGQALGARLVKARLGRLGAVDPFARTIVAAAGSLWSDDPPPSSSALLTAKERDILRELPVHQTVQDIAARQRLSPNTVKTHMRSIYQKLGASSRTEAVKRASAKGLL